MPILFSLILEHDMYTIEIKKSYMQLTTLLKFLQYIPSTSII